MWRSMRLPCHRPRFKTTPTVNLSASVSLPSPLAKVKHRKFKI